MLWTLYASTNYIYLIEYYLISLNPLQLLTSYGEAWKILSSYLVTPNWLCAR